MIPYVAIENSCTEVKKQCRVYIYRNSTEFYFANIKQLFNLQKQKGQYFPERPRHRKSLLATFLFLKMQTL